MSASASAATHAFRCGVMLETRLRWDSLGGELVMIDHTKSGVGGR